jgi:N-methylhydantoinase B
MFSTTIAAGDIYVHRMAGGGGWGDPLDREPERVAADVIDGKVTRESALEHYGVAIGDDGEVDQERTREERSGRR